MIRALMRPHPWFLQQSAQRHLWMFGVLTLIVYAGAFVAPFPLWRWATVPPVRDWPALAGYHPWAGLGLALAWITLFWCYGLAIQSALDADWPTIRTPVLAISWGSGLLLALGAYPGGAIDIYTYISHTRTFLMGANPFLVPPDSMPVNQALIPFLGQWRGLPSPYAPLLELVALVPGWAATLGRLPSAHTLGAEVVAFKVWAVVPLLALPLPLGAALRARGLPVGAGLLFVLWNPALLVELGANGHNDGWMLLALAGLFWAWATQRWWALWPLLATGIMLKWVPALLGPLCGIAQLQQGRSLRALVQALGGGGLALLVLFLSLAPVWTGLEDMTRWAVFNESNQPGFSLQALVLLWVDWLTPGQGAPLWWFSTTKSLGYIAFGLGALAAVAVSYRGAFASAAVLLLCSYLTVGAPAFRPWYPLWLLLPALFAPRFWSAGVVFGLSAQLAALLYGFGWRWLGPLGTHLLAVPLTIGPVWWAVYAHNQAPSHATPSPPESPSASSL